MKRSIRIGVLISGTGSNLKAIINACETNRIDGRVVFAGADRFGAKGLEHAEKLNIPTFVVNYAGIINQFMQYPDKQILPDDFDLQEILRKQAIAENENPARLNTFLKTRCIAEAALLEQMAPYPFDLLVLAGYMRNLTPYFIERVNTDPLSPRIMNIHPTILPCFPGTDGYGDTFRYGCKVGGCTVHFIDYGEDSGPIIGQRCFPIDENDTLETVKQTGLEQEWALFPHCIQLFAENRIQVVKTTHPDKNGNLFHRTIVKIVHLQEKET